MANDDTVDLDLMETAPGFDPDQPARPYFTMGGIVQRMLASSAFANHPVRALIGEELLLAIFWEETGFRNRRQQGDATFKASHQTWATRDASKTVGGFVAAGNHAVGFGQVERESIVLFKSQNATTKALDNFLPGVPDGKDVTIANVDMAILRNERLGAEISLRAFVHLHATFKTKREIAKRYGNKGAIMQQITDGWFTIERLLKAMKKMIRTSGNQLGENAFRKGIQMIAAIFWASRHDGPFGSAFGVSIGQPKVAILGRGLANLSFGASTTDPWGNPNLDTDLADFVAEFATRDLALDDTWVDKFVDKKFPGIGRRRIALGP